VVSPSDWISTAPSMSHRPKLDGLLSGKTVFKLKLPWSALRKDGSGTQKDETRVSIGVSPSS
jgi:hypothetical protein